MFKKMESKKTYGYGQTSLVRFGIFFRSSHAQDKDSRGFGFPGTLVNDPSSGLGLLLENLQLDSAGLEGVNTRLLCLEGERTITAYESKKE